MARNYRLFSDVELEQHSPPPDLVARILPQGALVVLVGDSGVGKSFLAIEVAFHVANGSPVLKRYKVRRGPVVYIAGEGIGGLPTRILAWKEWHDVKGEAGVYFLAEPVQFMDHDCVAALTRVLKTLPETPALIIVDTLARCLVGGDENSAQHMGLFVNGIDRIRRRTGATTLVVHHTGHDKSRERGSTALRGAADTVLRLRRKSAHSLELVCEKQKESAPFDPIPVVLDVVELPHASSCVMRRGSQRKAPDALSAKDQKALTALQRFGKKGATFKQWLEATGLSKATFDRARNTLVAAKIVVRREKIYVAKKTPTDGKSHGLK